MTTLVALAVDGVVWMAADSMVSLCGRPMPGSVQKIVRLPVEDSDTEALLGISGDGALAGLARQHLKLAAPAGGSADALRDFADNVAQAMTEIAREHGIVDEGRMDGTLLLGYAGRLWTLVHSQAVPHHDGTAGIGSGSDTALGALDALLSVGTDPEMAIGRAAWHGIQRDLHSAGPVDVESLPAAEKETSGG